MTDLTPILGLPLIAESQASAEIPHNESLTRLDSLAQIAVLDRDLATPPGSPAVGDTYLIATGGTGAWSGHDGDLAVYASGWLFTDVKPGMQVYVRDENKLLLRSNSSTWIDITPVGLATEAANTIYAGPATSPSATPTFRALVPADLPAASGSDAGSMSAAHFTLVNNATAANTFNAIVKRDGSGNFAAGTITVNILQNPTSHLFLTSNSASGFVIDFNSICQVDGTALIMLGTPIKGATRYEVGGNQVVGAQGAAVADATGALDVVAQLNALLARIRAHGLIAT